ncbi:Der GTPase-activating protein YihI [Colwellia sp. MEBiC06753]
MTRKKKSRKPGVGSSGALKVDKTQLFSSKDKKPKKKTGNAAGNRQQEAKANKTNSNTGNVNKDPRIGSKKPIVLVKESAAPEKKKASAGRKQSGIAGIRVIEQAPSIAQQLAAIEADERLQLILSKQEQDEALTAEEIDYYNQLMDEYETLSEQLPPEDETEISEVEDDDALWDKLDKTNFSDYE